jgi:hypothetical protein
LSDRRIEGNRDSNPDLWIYLQKLGLLDYSGGHDTREIVHVLVNHWIEGSDEFRAPTAIILENNPRCSLDWRLSGPSGGVWTLWRRQRPLAPIPSTVARMTVGADACWPLLIGALRNSLPAVACIDQSKESPRQVRGRTGAPIANMLCPRHNASTTFRYNTYFITLIVA